MSWIRPNPVEVERVAGVTLEGVTGYGRRRRHLMVTRIGWSQR